MDISAIAASSTSDARTTGVLRLALDAQSQLADGLLQSLNQTRTDNATFSAEAMAALASEQSCATC